MAKRDGLSCLGVGNYLKGKEFNNARTRKFDRIGTMIKPLHDRILIKPIANSEFSDGGIYRGSPMTTFVMDKEKTEQVTVGEVLAVGDGKYNRKGKRRAVDVPIGALVCFSDTCGKPVTEDGEEYLFIREGDVYGFLPEPTTVEHLYEKTTSIDSQASA